MLKKVRIKIPGSVPFSRSSPTVKGVYSGPRPVLHPSFLQICSVFFRVILLRNQPAKWHRWNHELLGSNINIDLFQALGVSSSQDRALIKKKIRDLKVLMEKAKRNREKVEKQREKLRKRELEQQQREVRKECATEWSGLPDHLLLYCSTTPSSISRDGTSRGPKNEPWGTPTQ